MNNLRIGRRVLLAGAAASVGTLGVSRFGVRSIRAAEPGGLPEYPIGVRQLFLDDENIGRMERVKRVLHQPVKYEGNPIIRHDQTPWQQFRAQLYGTSLYDPEEKLFKMWYLAGARLPFDEPVTIDGRKCVPNFQLVGYAESRDGYNFELPNLGLVDYNGSKENNFCRIARECVEGIAVVRTPHDSDPQRRYKSLYWEHLATRDDVDPGVSVNAMCVSFSADGKTWTNHAENPVMPYGSDTGQQALWDPLLQKYVAYGRFNAGGRRVARSESPDFIRWSEPKLVFEADAKDGPNAQVYGMGVSLYEGMYIGLPWMFQEGTTHKIDVQLTCSRDGINWNRVADRAVFIPNGPDKSWDAGIVFTASQPLVVKDDKIFIYYSASEHDHDYRQRPPEGTPEWKQHWDSIKTSIGVATLRRDGFVSLEPEQETGRLITKPFAMPQSGQLNVNVDAQDGAAHVTLRPADLNATPLARSMQVRGDQLNQAVEWSPAASLPASGEPVRLEFELSRARLYSYWFS